MSKKWIVIFLSVLVVVGCLSVLLYLLLVRGGSENNAVEPTEWFEENVPANYDPITNNDVDKDIARAMYDSFSEDQLSDVCGDQSGFSAEDAPAEAALVANGWLPLEPLFAAAGVDEVTASASFVLLDFNTLVAQECADRASDDD